MKEEEAVCCREGAGVVSSCCKNVSVEVGFVGGCAIGREHPP
jgi:hypothetical protein